MPDFNRLHMVNSMCPRANHDHRRANAAEIDIINKLKRKHLFGEESYCAICSVHYNNTLKLGWKCPNYRDVKIIELSNNLAIQNNSKLYFIYLPDYSRYKNNFQYNNYHEIKKDFYKLTQKGDLILNMGAGDCHNLWSILNEKKLK